MEYVANILDNYVVHFSVWVLSFFTVIMMKLKDEILSEFRDVEIKHLHPS